MKDPRYYRENRERLLAQTRAWKAANPDRVRQHKREHYRRVQARKKLTDLRRERGRAWYAEHREQERERARTFRREHPEKVREYQAKFRERHPERAAEQARRATEKWRDTNASQVRQTQRAAAEQRRANDPDAFRRWYQANLEKQRERGREASRLRSRLKKLGLPPRRIQRVYAEGRRANDRASDAFFTRRRDADELQRLRREGATVFQRPTAAQVAVIQARQRIMSSEELRVAGEHLQNRLRAAKTRDMAHAKREMARAFLPEAVAHVTQRRTAQLRREIELDSIGRQAKGAEPYDVEAELQRRIRQEAAKRVVAVAERSTDEEQMKRLMRASFPAAAKPRPATGATSTRGAERGSRATSSPDIER